MDQSLESKLAMNLAELELSVRATNCLESENIITVRDLVSRTEEQLLEVRNFGETTLTEVRDEALRHRSAAGHAAVPAAASVVSEAVVVGRSAAEPCLTSLMIKPDIPESLPCDTDDKAASSAENRTINGPCCGTWPPPCS